MSSASGSFSSSAAARTRSSSVASWTCALGEPPSAATTSRAAACWIAIVFVVLCGFWFLSCLQGHSSCTRGAGAHLRSTQESQRLSRRATAANKRRPYQMEINVYTGCLAVSAIITLLLTIKARSGSGSSAPLPADFKRFQMVFLVTYYVSMTADWLQGPYVYALYSSYGFSKHDIAVLFVGGFGASMLFGTFIGAAADKLGRKRLCLVYCVLYLLSCMTKHARDYNMLMMGRVLGGIATSLLFSSFESWMVCEHNARGFSAEALNDTFSLMYFGNSLCAILAGMVAEAAADAVPLTSSSGSSSGVWHYGGYCSPFDLSALCLVLAFGLICALWSENYGDSSDATTGCNTSNGALQQMIASPAILLCGCIASLFEGSMYIFVFNWTPALSSSSSSSPPFGLIFAAFMVASMGGSSLFAILSASIKCEHILQYAFLLGAASLALPIFFQSTLMVLVAFLLFEACVGIYWPAIGTVKSQIVPEESRATIYNLYRVPLNAIVLGVLLNHISTTTALTFCSGMLVLALVLQRVLIRRMASAGKGASFASHSDDEDDGKGALMAGSGKDF